MVPNRMENWTYETLETLCAAGQSESDRHDFKLGLQDARRTTKICCAFANSFGGYLAIGVGEKSAGFNIDGIQPSRELYGQLLAKIRAEPAIEISPPKTIAVPLSDRLVYLFEILASPRRPHLPTPADERVFWKRVGSDCVQMTLEEIRYQMSSYEEKREKLALLLIELNHIIRSLSEQVSFQDGQYNGAIFSFEIIDRVVVESYSILKADVRILGLLYTIKNELMLLNAEKQKMFTFLAMSYTKEAKEAVVVQYRDLVSRLLPHILVSSEQITNSLKNRFGIENPYSLS